MAFPLLFILFLSIPFSKADLLSIDYYKKTCPDFDRIIRETVTSKQITNPTTAAGTLRAFFHDCVVNGCDASVLISSNSFNKAERDADLNLSLSGDQGQNYYSVNFKIKILPLYFFIPCTFKIIIPSLQVMPLTSLSERRLPSSSLAPTLSHAPTSLLKLHATLSPWSAALTTKSYWAERMALSHKHHV